MLLPPPTALTRLAPLGRTTSAVTLPSPTAAFLFTTLGLLGITRPASHIVAAPPATAALRSITAATS